MEEVLHQQRNIFAALAQRRQIEADYVEAVKQVFAEAAFFHHLAEIHVGGGDDAHVHLNFLHAAQVHELAVLQHAQNLALRVHAHGADFVEEEGAAVGNFEQPFLRAETALVKAPLTCPNSVDSSRSGGVDPELTGTNGRSRRVEFK